MSSEIFTRADNFSCFYISDRIFGEQVSVPYLWPPVVVLLAVVGDDDVLPIAVRKELVAGPESWVLGARRKKKIP
jgi:hypothetical protein